MNTVMNLPEGAVIVYDGEFARVFPSEHYARFWMKVRHPAPEYEFQPVVDRDGFKYVFMCPEARSQRAYHISPFPPVEPE